MEKLIAKAMEMTVAQIIEAVTIIGGGMVSTEVTMVRAALIEAYINKTSEEQGDLLMDSIGL